MEHRLVDRLPLFATVDVYCRGEKLGLFPVKDIGADGLCMEDPGRCLTEGSVLQVVLPDFYDRRVTRIVMSALVIWTSKGYAGLMWTTVGNGLADYLDEIAKNNRPEPDAREESYFE